MFDCSDTYSQRVRGKSSKLFLWEEILKNFSLSFFFFHMCIVWSFPMKIYIIQTFCYFLFLCFLLKFFFNWSIVSATGWYTYIASPPHLVFLLICQDNRGRLLHNRMCYLCTDISFIDKKNQVLCIDFLLSFTTTKCREFHVMHMLYIIYSVFRLVSLF